MGGKKKKDTPTTKSEDLSSPNASVCVKANKNKFHFQDETRDLSQVCHFTFCLFYWKKNMDF